MKNRLFALIALLVGSTTLVSCIDPDQTQEVILEKDKEAIEAYIAANPFDAVKNYSEPEEGFYMFWEIANEAGRSIERGDTATVDYVGKLLNDDVFDTSIEQVARDNGIFANGRTYQPLKFRPGFNFAIVGFEFAIGLMKEGEKATVIFPSRLGYGTQPNGPVPANAPLIFEIELLKVDKVPQN